jgi:uncharacterized protein (DUF2336 family)
MTTARAQLTDADLRRLVKGDSQEDRAAAAEKLCVAVSRAGVTEAERLAAQNILRVMAEDTVVRVRKALAVTLRASPLLPRDAAMRLARDLDEIALPVINCSPVFTDEDLLEILAFASPEKQTALAQRPKLSARVTGAICETGVETAVAAVCANDNAAFEEPALAVALDRFPTSRGVTTALSHRHGLPLAIAERLLTLVGDDLRRVLAERRELKPEQATRLSEATRERITVDLVDQVALSADLAGFATYLNRNRRLTASLLLRVLARGQIAFFEHGLSELSGVPHARTWLMVHDAGPLGFKAVYERAGLPTRLFPAFRAGIDAWRSLQQEQANFTPAGFQERMIQRFLTSQPFAAREDLDYLLEKLDRRREDLVQQHANAA